MCLGQKGEKSPCVCAAEGGKGERGKKEGERRRAFVAARSRRTLRTLLSVPLERTEVCNMRRSEKRNDRRRGRYRRRALVAVAVAVAMAGDMLL